MRNPFGVKKAQYKYCKNKAKKKKAKK